MIRCRWPTQAGPLSPADSPIVYSSKAVGWSDKNMPCNVPMTICGDQDDAKVVDGQCVGEDPAFAGIYVHELVWDRNLLDNGATEMRPPGRGPLIPASGGTNIAVYRFPNQASDGTAYLATNWRTGMWTEQQFRQTVVTAGGGGPAFASARSSCSTIRRELEREVTRYDWRRWMQPVRHWRASAESERFVGLPCVFGTMPFIDTDFSATRSIQDRRGRFAPMNSSSGTAIEDID